MSREYIIKISDEIMEEEVANRPQELVRCKDCKHYKWLVEACDHVGGSVTPDWFCADAERR